VSRKKVGVEVLKKQGSGEKGTFCGTSTGGERFAERSSAPWELSISVTPRRNSKGCSKHGGKHLPKKGGKTNGKGN